jgi:hypothetical protein
VRHATKRSFLLGAVLALASHAPEAACAWDVRCVPPGEPADAECPDPFANVRTLWGNHPLAEHRLLLVESLQMAGLPASLQDPFSLTVYTGSETLEAAGGVYDSIRPVLTGAALEQTRTLTVPMMANMPDFAYTLWDWASGNELCPPDPSNPNALDCHNYETHIGWLNSNHMLPQARHWYGYLHGLALERAGACKDLSDSLEQAHRERFLPWLEVCEKEALVLEAVGQHYLQDAWAIGHMIERWGSTEVADFGGDRAVGFGISGLVGAIHGSKAMLDEDPLTVALAPWDDPLNAPHADVAYVDGLDGPVPQPGVGDRFLPQLLGFVPGLADYGAQREALFGCAVDGLREVYAATAQLHGPLATATGSFDARRQVEDDSCWAQRVTNRSFNTGFGVHRGPFDGPAIALIPGVVGWTLGEVLGFFVVGSPLMAPLDFDRFRIDAGFVSALSAWRARFSPDETGMASGAEGLELVGIGANSVYARGGPGVPPASYSDPLLPWNLSDPDARVEERKQILNLTFADAHAADRCAELDEADLLAYVDAAQQAAGGDPELAEAACGQCVQMVAPQLRFGVEGSHDANREAFCALVAEAPLAPAFLYTGEEGPFTGTEPDDLASLRSAARARCCSGGGGDDLSGVWGGTCTEDSIDPFEGDCELNIEQNGAQLSGTLGVCGAGTTVSFSATASGGGLSNVVIDNGQGCVSMGSGSVTGDQLTITSTGMCPSVGFLTATVVVTRDVRVCP